MGELLSSTPGAGYLLAFAAVMYGAIKFLNRSGRPPRTDL